MQPGVARRREAEVNCGLPMSRRKDHSHPCKNDDTCCESATLRRPAGRVGRSAVFVLKSLLKMSCHRDLEFDRILAHRLLYDSGQSRVRCGQATTAVWVLISGVSIMMKKFALTMLGLVAGAVLVLGPQASSAEAHGYYG